MDIPGLLGIVVGVIVAVTVIPLYWPKAHTVLEHQRAVRFMRGRLVGEVGPGRYWIFPRIEQLVILDGRRRQAVIAGQEVLTADRVPLKVSLVAEFTVTNATKAVTVVEDFQAALYANAQLALREVLATKELEAALAERGEIGDAIAQSIGASGLEFGVELHRVRVRDFMMGGGLRNAFADVLQARQQGLAALERARGESAAVRNLANAAQIMEKHPGLMHLRLLQSVENSTGNRIVIALDPGRAASAGVQVAAEGDS